MADPVGALPLPGVPALLTRLASRFGLVAVVSGRPVDFLERVLGSPVGVSLIGLYGLGQVGPDARSWAGAISEAAAEARADAPDGVYVEPKGLTVTLHWRNAPGAGPWATAFADRQEDERGLEGPPRTLVARTPASARRGQGDGVPRAGRRDAGRGRLRR